MLKYKNTYQTTSTNFFKGTKAIKCFRDVITTEIIKTKRLLLIEYTYEMIQATMCGNQALEKISGYEAAKDWPGIDFFFYLPYILEEIKKDNAIAKWSRLIVLRSEKKIIGEIGAQGKPNLPSEIELGYSIVNDYQGKGYMTEALSGMVAWLDTKKQIKRIFARCYDSNHLSIKVLKKNGFIYQPDQDKKDFRGRIITFEWLKRSEM